MKILSISLIILFIGFFLSCQDSGQDDFFLEGDNDLKALELEDFELKLQQLSLFFGEVLRDPEARKELFGFAKLKGNANDVEYSLKKLFEERLEPLSRKESAIVSAFYRKAAENHRQAETPYNVDELIEFIVKNDIGILAPYLVENFSSGDIHELTVSWWLEEYEVQMLSRNKDWKGETKGNIINLDKALGSLAFEKFGVKTTGTPNEVIVNDQYAMKNPTIVLGKFEIGEYEDHSTEVEGKNRIATVVNSANCEDLTATSLVRIEMPEFRLTSSIRPWPHPDGLLISLMVGNPNGTIPFEYTYWGGWKKVSRSDTGSSGNDWHRTDISFLVQNWSQNQINMQFVLWNKKPWQADEVQVETIIKVTPGSAPEIQYKTIGGIDMYQKHFATHFDRCATIETPFYNGAFGLRNGFTINRFGNFDFYLKPVITL